MLDRPPHPLSPVKHTRTPSVLVCFDARLDTDKNVHWYACTARREGETWTRFQCAYGHDAESFWQWLWNRPLTQRRAWVVATNLARAADAIGLALETTETETAVDSALVSERCVVLELSRGPRKYTLLDLHNLWDSLPQGIDTPIDSPLPARQQCEQSARATYQLLTTLFNFVNEFDLGGIHPTVGAWSSNLWRHWYKGNPVIVHDCTDSIALERSAYFGGQVIVHREGVLDGPFYGIDVNMMYPYAMAMYQCPRRLIEYIPRADKALLESLTVSEGAIAEVLLNTGGMVYPYRRNKQSLTARGEFWTCLAWPELSFALAMGHVEQVSRCSVFQCTDMFSAWAERIWNTRNDISAKYGKGLASLVKRLAASLHGKFAQHGVDWADCEEPLLNPWSWWFAWDGDRFVRRRAIGWNVQQKMFDAENEPNDSFPAIAAWTTSAARMFMLGLREICGPENWVYQYSDSLVVSVEGRSRLEQSGMLQPDQLGKCKEDWVSQSVEIRGPGWLLCDDRRRTCGVAPDAEEIETDTYLTEREATLAGMIGQNGPKAYTLLRQVTHYPPAEIKGIRRADGWIDPPEIVDTLSRASNLP